MDAVEDLFSNLVTLIRETDPEKKKVILEKLEKETFPFWFSCLEKQIKQFGKGNHSVGDRMTIADLKITGSLNRIFAFLPKTLLDGYPLLKAVVDNVNQNPKIIEYEENLKKKN